MNMLADNLFPMHFESIKFSAKMVISCSLLSIIFLLAACGAETSKAGHKSDMVYNSVSPFDNSIDEGENKADVSEPSNDSFNRKESKDKQKISSFCDDLSPILWYFESEYHMGNDQMLKDYSQYHFFIDYSNEYEPIIVQCKFSDNEPFQYYFSHESKKINCLLGQGVAENNSGISVYELGLDELHGYDNVFMYYYPYNDRSSPLRHYLILNEDNQVKMAIYENLHFPEEPRCNITDYIYDDAGVLQSCICYKKVHSRAYEILTRVEDLDEEPSKVYYYYYNQDGSLSEMHEHDKSGDDKQIKYYYNSQGERTAVEEYVLDSGEAEQLVFHADFERIKGYLTRAQIQRKLNIAQGSPYEETSENYSFAFDYEVNGVSVINGDNYTGPYFPSYWKIGE